MWRQLPETLFGAMSRASDDPIVTPELRCVRADSMQWFMEMIKVPLPAPKPAPKPVPDDWPMESSPMPKRAKPALRFDKDNRLVSLPPPRGEPASRTYI